MSLLSKFTKEDFDKLEATNKQVDSTLKDIRTKAEVSKKLREMGFTK